MSGAPPRLNRYEGVGLDRAAALRGDADWLAAQLRAPESRFVAVWRSQSLIAHRDEPDAVLLSYERVRMLILEPTEPVLLGLERGIAHFALDLSHLEAPDAEQALAEHGRFVDLRSVGATIAHRQGSLLAYARGIVHWHQRHRFCGVCGQPTRSREAGHARRCSDPACGADHFPRTDPAVIMGVIDPSGERLLLGRQASWPPGMHSVLAGFVEPGESLEEAVRREVAEEVGLEVGQVTYRSSQPWPFPSSIMLGFVAQALGDRLTLDAREIEQARWYSRAELIASPEDERFRLPRRDSIARRLIEDWIAGD